MLEALAALLVVIVGVLAGAAAADFLLTALLAAPGQPSDARPGRADGPRELAVEPRPGGHAPSPASLGLPAGQLGTGGLAAPRNCRRTRAVGRCGRPGAPRRGRRPRDGIAELAREVLEGAVRLDGQIVSSNLLARGHPRAQALAQVEYQVGAIEDAARRVHQLAEQRARLAQSSEVSSLSLQDRIAAMEAALSELTPRPPGPGKPPGRQAGPTRQAGPNGPGLMR